MQKRILSVQDISCFGKCSTGVALPVLSAAGHECVILPTALLSTHTGGFEGYTFLDLTEEMRKILAHWQKLGLRFDAVQTGYFGSLEQMAIVRDFVAGRELLRFVDPVLGDHGGLYSIYDQRFVEAMRDFCRGADVITPNLTEACLLTDTPYTGSHVDDVELDRLAGRLLELGVGKAVITGIRFSEQETGILAADRETGLRECFRTPYVDIFFPGTGDTFASALCGKLMAGTPFREAAQAALDFTFRSICDTVPTDIRYGLCFEQELKTLG